jgi:hypothetical protein
MQDFLHDRIWENSQHRICRKTTQTHHYHCYQRIRARGSIYVHCTVVLSTLNSPAKYLTVPCTKQTDHLFHHLHQVLFWGSTNHTPTQVWCSSGVRGSFLICLLRIGLDKTPFLYVTFCTSEFPSTPSVQPVHTGTSQSHTNAFSHQHLPGCTGIGSHFLGIVVWGLTLCGSTLARPIMHAQVT